MAIVWTMPRRSILSSAVRDSLFVLPDTQDEIIRYYTLTESDLAITNQHRGGANRLGFAVQLCYMRYPGRLLSADEGVAAGSVRNYTLAYCAQCSAGRP